MLRIDTLYKNRELKIMRVEGELREADESCWVSTIKKITNSKVRNVILDLCGVSFLSDQAVNVLMNNLTGKILIMNCKTSLRNRPLNSGFRQNIL